MLPFIKKSVFILSSLFFCTTATANRLYDATVSNQAKSGEFLRINDALNAAPTDSNQIYTILIKNGIYNEMITISRPNIVLIGENETNTIIEYNLAAGMLNKNGKKIGTTGSAIFVINASNFTAENLTIRNSFDYPANQMKAKDDPTRLKDTQAVAVMVDKNSDQVRFRHVTLSGYQDTLYLKTNSRSYFTQSTISGHVDFIFGDGTAVFNDCTIVARNRNDIETIYGYITAPSTNINQPYGLIVMNSHLTKEQGVPANSFAFGRPWHPTTDFADGRYADPDAVGMALFMNNQVDDHIYGWDQMAGKDINGEKIWFQPEQSRFYEFSNSGIGATRKNNHYLIEQSVADRYQLKTIFQGWPEHLLK